MFGWLSVSKEKRTIKLAFCLLICNKSCNITSKSKTSYMLSSQHQIISFSVYKLKNVLLIKVAETIEYKTTKFLSKNIIKCRIFQNHLDSIDKLTLFYG